MSERIAKVEVEVEPDLDTFEASLDRALARAFEPMSTKASRAGQQIGSSLHEGIGKIVEKDSITPKLMKSLLKPAAIAGLVAVGARWGAVLLSGLVPYVAQVGPIIAGGAVAGAAGLGLLLPPLFAIKSAFAGIKKENKTFFEDLLKPFKGIGEAGRDQMVPALKDTFKNLEALIPALTTFSGAVNKSAGDVMRFVSSQLALKGNTAIVDRFLTGSAAGFDKISDALGRAIVSMIPALDSIVPLMDRVATAVSGTLDSFADTMDEMNKTGELDRRLTDLFDKASRVGSAFKDAFVGVVNILRIAAGISGDFTVSMASSAEEFRNWTESFAGKNRIREFFLNVQEPTKEFMGLLGDIGGLFKESFTGDTGNMTDFIRSLRTDFIPMVERFQDVLRNSGIQDSLYDLVEAILSLSEAGGGAGMAAFLDVFTQVVDAFTMLLSIPGFGTLASTLLAIMGAMRAYTVISGAAASLGLFATNLAKAGAASKMPGVSAMMTGKEGGKGGLIGYAGKAKSFAGKAGGAAMGLMVANAVIDPIADSMRDGIDTVDMTMDLLSKRIEGGAKDLSTAMEGLGNSDGMVTWKSILGGKNEWGGQQMFKGAQGTLATMSDKIEDQTKGWNRALNSAWTLLPGTEDLFAGVEEDFNAISGAIANIAATDPETARTWANELKTSLEDAGLSAEEVEARMKGINDAIAASVAGTEISITGDFSDVERGLATVDVQLGETLRSQIVQVTTDPANIDQVTGTLNEVGRAKVATILAQVDMPSVNGAKGVLSDAAQTKVASIFADPKNIDKTTGDLTEAAKDRIAKILAQPENIITVKEQLDALAKDRVAWITVNQKRGDLGGAWATSGNGDKDRKLLGNINQPNVSVASLQRAVNGAVGLASVASASSATAARKSERSGPVVAIDTMVMNDGADISDFARKVGFAVRTA